MKTCKAGVPMAHCLVWSVLSTLLVQLCLSAPGQPEVHREGDSVAAIANPFQSNEENHRLLRSYVDSVLNKEGQEKPEIDTWEQQVFFLFSLHDYDRSGFLDGLELIKLLIDVNAFHTPGVVYSYSEVVFVVDFLLQTQDLNRDGLFSPSELLSPPFTQHEEKDTMEVAENEAEVQTETQPEQDKRTEEDSPVAPVEEEIAPQETQNTEVTEPAENMASVHQGQPEI